MRRARNRTPDCWGTGGRKYETDSSRELLVRSVKVERSSLDLLFVASSLLGTHSYA